MSKKQNLVRVNIMFDQPTLDVVDELAKTLSVSRSQLVRDLLKESAPELQRLSGALQGLAGKSPTQIAVAMAKMKRIAAKDFGGKAMDYLEG